MQPQFLALVAHRPSIILFHR